VRAFAARFAIAAVVVSLLMGAAVYAANDKVTAALGSIKKVTVKVTPIGPGEPANFLLLGSDTRAFATTAEQKNAFGDPNAKNGPGGQRADSIMVMHVDANAKKILLMSIPRDTWVDIPGIGMSKINAALNGANGISGPDLLIQTINKNFNIDINHYLAVNFETFAGVVDAIGSIPIWFPTPVRDYHVVNGRPVNETGLDVKTAGCQMLDGQHALEYVRSRYYQTFVNGRWVTDPTSDLGRVKRQQDFLRILATQAVKKGLDDPLTAGKITDKLLPNLTTDTALTNDTLLRLINAYRNVKPDDPNAVQTMTLPVVGAVVGGQDVLKVDHGYADIMLLQLRNFTPKVAATATTAATGPSPSAITVKVLNRNGGVAGGAAAALGVLTKDGFVGVGAGTGDSGRAVTKTEVRYASGDEAKAKVVQSYLAGGGTLVADSTITDHHITVVLGADFTSVIAPATSTTTTTTTTSATTPPKSPTATTESPQVATARAACA
jgi:LCP family protein required for cell wall assembly